MDGRQEYFENSVILESELGIFHGKGGEEFIIGLDNLNKKCLTLNEVMSEYGKDIDFEVRQLLYIIVRERLARLNEFQKKVAEMKYLKGLTVRDIAKETGKGTTTIQYHIEKINKVIRSI